MSQDEVMISVLSEMCAGRKLKRIEWKAMEGSLALITVVFEGDDGGEQYVDISGQYLSAGFGWRNEACLEGVTQ